ncbi:hypothetical protein EMIHUDRAFT_219492 [Emiliania huxleyi CCMP1516]|uniref:Endonuclease/exonuclease/phosphatase domain-containing protein n=2 Tax=Emiliania huxleyi TaxID=2903 RepID=A0A0D3I4G9_EMIH1|nr:hypothetical protein EMIHUDRAFT_219492 [Emiliania huxleyi CCMP1516]EOD06154.1 hypothetical protein EMIHUDRAFT_219492 [Emiliania huxleyi CCMP1516]|eukprot:XP_005758583.1 hypothetical protein EMIHUDRAFT_219492 [Emiliania huxleyi CCMP1516]
MSSPPTISRLRLLSDQPVEGCELTPDIFLANGVPAHTCRLEYKWYRSITKMACSWCGKTPVIMQRLTDDSYFCSVACFTNAWQGHPNQHRTGLTSSGVRTETAKQAEGWVGRDFTETTEQKWVEVSDVSTYIPSLDDAVTPLSADGSQKGIAKTLKTNYPGTNRTNANRLGFTLLTYNVLSEIYATADAYPYCAAWALPWNYRRRNIMRELINYRADIMCLQEVQADHFENFLEPELAKYNYAGHDVEFNTIARQRHSNDRNVLNRLLKDNVAQLLVANTHINASPEFADVKLWQTQHLVLEIERMLTQHSGSTSTIPVVAAGDFNSLPGSDPHTLLANGLVQPENGDPSGVLATLPLRHSLPLRSAMATVGAHANASAESHELQRMEPPYTNYTTSFVGTLDYIFYTVDRLSVGGLLQMVDDRQVQEHTALPSPLFSSDHTPLLSEFHFKR